MRLGNASLDLGDLCILVAAGNLGRLRDVLHAGGYQDASDLAADLTDIAEDYLQRKVRRGASEDATR